MAKTGIKSSELEQFLTQFTQLPKQMIEGIKKSTTDEDYRAVSTNFLIPLQEQFDGIASFLRENIENESENTKSEINQLVIKSAGISMTKSAQKISLNLKSIFSKLGLNRIIKEIKKLIFFILDLINAPKWIRKILLIIDQILNDLLGWDLPETEKEVLSMYEQAFYKELAAQNIYLNTIQRDDNE